MYVFFVHVFIPFIYVVSTVQFLFPFPILHFPFVLSANVFVVRVLSLFVLCCFYLFVIQCFSLFRILVFVL